MEQSIFPLKTTLKRSGLKSNNVFYSRDSFLFLYLNTKEMKIQKALFIENEFFSSMSDTEIGRIHRRLQEMGVECKVIDQASKHKKEVFEGALWADSILFASTFLYSDEVKGVGDLLIKIPQSKKIYGYCMSGNPLVYEVENLWSLKELSDMSHHNLFEISHSHFDEDFGDDYPWAKKIDLKCYADQWKQQEEERIKKNQGFPKTGRLVKIGKIQAQGVQWSKLEEGMIIPELDCTEIDPNPKRGIWVMGFDEPVKLLNSDGYEEWEYAEVKAMCLAREFFARGNALDKKELIQAVAEWINGGGIASMDGSELWEWCDNLCSTIGVERRGNRSYFERRLKEYGKKYTYFREVAKGRAII